MCEYDYAEMSDQMLAGMIAYNTAKFPKAPPSVLAEVREDLEEMALLAVAVAEYLEEKMAGVHGAADSMFIAPPAGTAAR